MLCSAQKMKTLLQKICGKRILVVGDVMLDHYIHGDATRISPEAMTFVGRSFNEKGVTFEKRDSPAWIGTTF